MNLFQQKILFFFFFILFTLTIFIDRPKGLSLTNGDEPHYLIMTYSMLYDGDLDIVNNYKNYSYHSWYTVPFLTEHTFLLNHKKYPIHQIGLSAYILPAFAIGGRTGAAIFMAFLTSLALVNMYKILQYFVTKKIAWFTIMIAGLAMPIFVYSILMYPEVALLFLMSWILLIILNPKFKLNLRNGSLLVLLVSLIPPLHIKFGLLIGIMLLYITVIQYNKMKLTNLILFDLAASIGSSLFLIWMYFWFEGRFTEAMYFISAKNKFLLEYIPGGLLGSLVDRESGILIFAPIYIYIFIGFGFFWKKLNFQKGREKITGLFILTTILVQTIFVCMYPHMISGQNPAGRYFLPIFPLLLIILATSFDALWNYIIHRYIIAILCIYTLIISTIIALNPILALPFSQPSNLVNFLFGPNAPTIHEHLPDLSRFNKPITFEAYKDSIVLVVVLLLATYAHLIYTKKVVLEKTRKKFTKS